MTIATARRDETRNIWLLTLSQALAGANSVVIFATGAIVGNELAPSLVLSTLPLSIFVVGMALSTLPIGQVAYRHGRSAAFMCGTLAGILAGMLATMAVLVSSFWLFCGATFFGGVYAAVVLTFRFAVADGVSAERKAKALSLVMGGGVAAGVLGPQLVILTMGWWPDRLFAATFVVQALVAGVAGILLQAVRLPKPDKAQLGPGRPLRVLATQPLFLAAVICGAASYLVMNFLMTSAPLSMHLHGHSHTDSNLGIQWHVIAMYAPSFVTGSLIARFGAITITIVGLVLTGGSIVIGLAGVALIHFWGMLIILGIGWNFGFLGASAMILRCHRPEETTRVQSLNDFIIFGLMAIGSFSSGGVLGLYGWDAVLWLSLAPLGLTVAALWLAKKSGN